MFTRQSQAGKSAAVRAIHKSRLLWVQVGFKLGSLRFSQVLSGSLRFTQVHSGCLRLSQVVSGSLRFFQVFSGFFRVFQGFFRFDGYLNVYEVEPSWHVSSSQDPFIYYVQFGFKLGSLSFSEVF